MLNILKVGPKSRHLEIPDGWYILVNQEMKTGDLVANIHKIKWEPIDSEDVALNSNIYDFVIRKY